MLSEYPLVSDIWHKTEIQQMLEGILNSRMCSVRTYPIERVNAGDSSECLVITHTETTKVTYRPMPSSSSNFVGRVDYLAKLEAVFIEGRTQTGSRPVGVLSGLGGVGKTQLSVKFAETRSHL